MTDIIDQLELEKLLPDQKEENDDAFLFLGKNQSGKTTLINILCNDNNEVGGQGKACTKEVKKSFGENKSFVCIDTPGTYDLNCSQEEINKKIIEFFTKEEDIIKIKGIFIVMNFQEESFDKSHYETLLNMFKIFPFRKHFWENVTICFTHYSSFENDYPKEVKKTKKEPSLKKFVEDFINNFKEYSLNEIKFEQIKIFQVDLIYDYLVELRKEYNKKKKLYDSIKKNDASRKKEISEEIKFLEEQIKSKEEQNDSHKNIILERIHSLKNEKCICQSKKKVITKDKFVIEQLADKETMIYQIDLHSIDFYDEENKYICSRFYYENKREYRTIKVKWLRKYYRRFVGGIGGGITLIGAALLTGGLLIPGINIAEGVIITLITTTSISTFTSIGNIFCCIFDKKSDLMQKIDGYENIEKFENKK